MTTKTSKVTTSSIPDSTVNTLLNGMESPPHSKIKPPPLGRRIRLTRKEDTGIEETVDEDDAGILGDVSAEPSFDDPRQKNLVSGGSKEDRVPPELNISSLALMMFM